MAQPRVGAELHLHDAAERRQLSVVFIDLVSSTELSARLDPEDLGQVIGAFQRACATAVTEFGGSIAKYMGDGALAYFGYPEAHEDDAERAVRAGLTLVDAIAAMELPLALKLQVRDRHRHRLDGRRRIDRRGQRPRTRGYRRVIEFGFEGSGRSVAKLGCGRGIDSVISPAPPSTMKTSGCTISRELRARRGCRG